MSGSSKEKIKEYNRNYYLKHKEKISKQDALYYQSNKESIKKRVANYKKSNLEKINLLRQERGDKYYRRIIERRKENKVEAIKLKGSKCVVCGLEYNGKNASCFDFHHIDSESKEYSPSTVLRMSRDKQEKELSKCMLVCSNCHRLIHYEEY